MKKAFLSFLLVGVFLLAQAKAQVMCTMEYAPVCGKVQVQCIKAPCEPILQTFSNRCMLEANKLATFMRTGECEKKQEECWKIINNKRVWICNRLPSPEECPRFAPPSPSFCPNGVIVDGGKDILGCPLPPRCVTGVNMKNPAAVHCLKVGGRLEIKETSGGQQGICIFDDGTICDERALFRGECDKKRIKEESSQNVELHDCVIFFDGCNVCVVESENSVSCEKERCLAFTGNQKCLVNKEKILGLERALEKFFLKYQTHSVKERILAKLIGIFQEKISEIQILGTTEEYLTKQGIYQFLVWKLEKELEKICAIQNGKLLKVGKKQIYTCNKKTPDANKKCTSNEQCSTLCLAPGRCAPTTVNVGCFDVMKQGKRVKICID